MSRTISTVHPGVLAIFEQVALVDDSAKCYTGPRLETWYWSEEDLTDIATELLQNLSEIVPSFVLPSPELIVAAFLQQYKD